MQVGRHETDKGTRIANVGWAAAVEKITSAAYKDAETSHDNNDFAEAYILAYLRLSRVDMDIAWNLIRAGYSLEARIAIRQLVCGVVPTLAHLQQ